MSATTYVFYGQIRKISTVNVLVFEHFISYNFGLNFAHYAVVSSNVLSGMANSVDPDQTAAAILLETLVFKFF